MLALTVHSPDQVERIAQLARKIWRAHYISLIGAEQVTYMLRSIQSAEAISQAIAKGTVYHLLCDQQGHDVGYCAYEQRADHCFLSKLYVDAACRGQGYGQQALSLVEAAARDAQQASLRLTVNKDNCDSIQWYQRHGFEIVDEIVIDIGGGHVMDDYVLSKDI